MAAIAGLTLEAPARERPRYTTRQEIKDSAPNFVDRTDYGPSIDTLEAARLAGTTREHITACCRDGQIKSVRLGRRWVINTDAFFELLGL